LKDNILTIITEGGKQFGFGHITRCLSIAKIFEQHNYKVHFIIKGDNSICSLINNYSYNILNWQDEKIISIDTIQNSSFILVDSILIKDTELLSLEEINIPIIFIDDEKRRNILTKGFVIDWTVLSEKNNYFNPKKENVSYLLGSKYTPLRDEFTNASLNNIEDNINTIMVTLGGADIRNLTPIILENLNKFLPNCKKNIVIGNAFLNIKEIKKYKDINTTLIYNASALQMLNLMQKSDIAIASGGQTLYELARVGTPTIAIVLVENAKDDTLGWEKVGSIKNIGWWNDKHLISKLKRTLVLLKDKNQRQKMQDCTKNFINPNGAKLLVSSILGKL